MSLGARGSAQYAHRISWTIANGLIADGMYVLHKCDNPPCVRPDHLFIGSHAENMSDMVSKGRQHRGVNTGGVVLNDATVGEILRKYSKGDTSALALASAYCVQEATVRAIINGLTWTHVDGPRLTRDEIIAIGKRNRAAARIASKRANGWRPGACSACGKRGHYRPKCPESAP